MNDEKGPINSMLALIVMVASAVLILIFVGVLGGQTYTLSQPMINAVGNYSQPMDNVTGPGILNNTAYYLDYPRVQPGTLTLFNGTSGVAYPIGNFSVDYPNGIVRAIGPFNVSSSNLNASYYYWDSSRDNIISSIQSSFLALNQTGNYLPIIVLAIIIAIVLSLVVGFTSLGGNNSGPRNAL
jgi:hypothetical protein